MSERYKTVRRRAGADGARRPRHLGAQRAAIVRVESTVTTERLVGQFRDRGSLY